MKKRLFLRPGPRYWEADPSISEESLAMYRQYLDHKRVRNYESRLIEKTFSLSMNQLVRKGVFSSMLTTWDYESLTRIDGYLGGVTLIPVGVPGYKELYLWVEDKKLLNGHKMLDVNFQSHPLVKSRYWFICPGCGQRVVDLYIPQGVYKLACRHCHRLVYWSQMRGPRRIGVKKYNAQKVLSQKYYLLKRLDIDITI